MNRFFAPGFTLLEVMISFFILTIIGILIGTGLNMVMRAQYKITAQNKQLGELQIAMSKLQRDIQQVVYRPIKSPQGQLSAFIFSDQSIEFTHLGFLNPLGLKSRSTLQRVRYYFIDSTLHRKTWATVDRSNQTFEEDEIILTHIKSLHFSILPPNSPLNNPVPAKPSEFSGLNIQFEIENWGMVRRLFLIPTYSFLEKNYVSTLKK